MNDTNDDRKHRLTRDAGRLAKEIRPPSDLWPGIEREIRRSARRQWTGYLAQAAVVVLLVGGSSTITYFAVRDDAVPVQQVAPELVFQPAAFGRNYALGPDFTEVRGILEADLEDELVRLSPEARADVEKNLALIRAAIADINKALVNDPGNALLQELLLKSYRDELAVMQDVGSLAQHVMSRKDI